MKRVLIVDDHEENRYLLRALLAGNGFQVTEARNGAEALEKAREHVPDLVVSDILMPVMDGFALCRAWRADPETAAVPFVFYTATYTDARDRTFALDLGADAFVVKPVEPEEFVAAMWRVLEGVTRTIPEAAAAPPEDERALLREYNEVLIRKLEEKVCQLEEATRKVAESEELFRTAFEGAAIGRCLTTPDGRFLKVNRALCELLGYSEAELSAKTFADVTHPADVVQSAEAVRALLAGEGRARSFEKRYVAKDGRVVWVLVTTILRRDGSGTPLNFITDVQDLTAGKQAEEERFALEAQLQQAQRLEAVGRLAGGVAHDFNNLLTVILGLAELAALDLAPQDPLRSKLDGIHDAGGRAAGLTRQLLAFARQQVVCPRALDLNEAVGSLQKMLRRLIGEDIELQWKPGADVCRVYLDPSQVDQLLANLVVNARDAIPNAGTVVVETSHAVLDDAYCALHAGSTPGEYAVLVVSDTGVGMDRETLAHIFEPFFTTKEPGKGTGLGLATVYGIVKQAGGSIYAYSEPGQGTTFRVYLPVWTGGQTASVLTSEVDRPLPGTETVLLVEDEAAILELGRAILQRQGYRVLLAHSPGEALLAAEKEPGTIHLLATDVVMPGMNGRELCERLRIVRPTLKCLYLSGYTADAISQRGVLPAGVNFLQKPYSMKDLAGKVRAVLDAG
ncbi:MAG: response regulator [Deltaproteobacteria bacterium]|nr:response regulator [Deltaproteobacteria bacterium]